MSTHYYSLSELYQAPRGPTTQTADWVAGSLLVTLFSEAAIIATILLLLVVL